MSLIRSTSNPEGLYIFESQEKGQKSYTTNIWWSIRYPLSSYKGKIDDINNREIIIPSTVFYKAVKLWDRQHNSENISVKGFTEEDDDQ